MAMRSEVVASLTPVPTTKDPGEWPFTNWPAVVVIHTVAAFAVTGLGTYVVFAQKGTYSHRMLGRAWCLCMVVTSLTSFGIHGISSHISFIHGLSVYVLFAIAMAIYHIRHKNVTRHKWYMISCYAATLLAGLLTIVIPGRRFYNLLFGVPKTD